MIFPDAMLGMLGGGQLGRLFTLAAHSMGYRVMVLDPDPHSPAGCVADEHLAAALDDPSALQTMAERCAAVTTEFENVPAVSLEALSRHCVVRPASACVAVAQDRQAEKEFFTQIGLAVAPYATIQKYEDIDNLASDLLPGILKLCRLGYDGKGQIRVATKGELTAAFEQLGQLPCVLEQLQDLALEVSAIVARRADGTFTTFPVAENRHADGILDVSIVPARTPENIQDLARQQAVKVATSLNYCGILAVEYFVLKNGRLLANEMAPRPHNSGHYSIDACVTSQFEQQVRTLCDLPLGDTSLRSPVVMVNLLGDSWTNGMPAWNKIWSHPRAKLHLYGKREARSGRKMGHFTCVAETAEAALSEALAIQRELTLR